MRPFSTIHDPERRCHHVSVSTDTRAAMMRIANNVRINTNRRKFKGILSPEASLIGSRIHMLHE